MVILNEKNTHIRDGKVYFPLKSEKALSYLKRKQENEQAHLNLIENRYREFQRASEQLKNETYLETDIAKEERIKDIEIVLKTLNEDIIRTKKALRNIQHALQCYYFIHDIVLVRGEHSVKMDSINDERILPHLIQKYRFLNKTHYTEWKEQNKERLSQLKRLQLL